MAFFLPHQEIALSRQTGFEIRSLRLSSSALVKLVLCSLLLYGSGFSTFIRPAYGEDVAKPTTLSDSGSETRLSIPWEQFSTVVEQYGSGVLLPQAEFETLWKSAEESRKAVPEGVDPVLVERCDVEITLVDHQILSTYLIDLKRLGPGLQSWAIPLKQLGIDRASIGEKPARLGRLNGTGPVVVFLDQPGEHRLRLETRLSVVNSGRRLLFSLPQVNAPAGRMKLSLPAAMNVWSEFGMRLSDQVEGDKRSVEWILDGEKDWEASFGPADGPGNPADDAIKIRHWTETTLLGLFAAGELNWQGTLKIHPLSEAFQQLRLRLPKGFRLIQATADGLTDWSVTPVPDAAGEELLDLQFRQPVRTPVELKIEGIATKASGEDWTISGFHWEDGSPQLTRLILGHAAKELLQIRRQEGTQLEPLGGGEFEYVEPREDYEHDSRFLRFSPTSGNFTVECRSLEALNQFAADLQSHTKLTTRGAESTTILTLDALGNAPLPNEIRVDFPVEWTVTEVRRRPTLGRLEGQSETDWNVDSEDASQKQLRIRIEALNVPGDRFIIRAVMPLRNWPLEQGVSNLTLPKWRVNSAYSTTGLLMVSAEEPIQFRPVTLQGLAPTAPVLTEGRTPVADLYYRINLADYAGEIELTRYQSRLAAFSTTTAKLNRDKLHCRLESLLQVSGSGTREIQLSLPVECGNDLRFNLVGDANEVVSQSVAPGEEGRNNWTLKLKQRAIGDLRIVTEMFISRNEEAETKVPLVTYPTAERQSGQVIVDADAEQFLTVRGVDAIGRELPEQGLSDLVVPASYPLPDRIAAAYRVPGAGCSVVMTEQRFQSEILPGAICDQLALQTVMGGSTQNIHEAVWVVRHGRLQSFILTMGAEQELWSAELDGHPVEINQSGENEVKIKVPVTENPLKTSQIRILYGGKNSVVTTTSNWKGQAPELVAEYSAKDRRPVEILDQDWMLFHPSELEIAAVEAPYQAVQQEQGSWFSWLWNIHLSRELFFRLMFLGAVFFLVLVSWGIAELIRRKIEIGRVVPGLIVLAILSVVTALLLPPVQQARQASRRTEERNKKRQEALELEQAMEARVSSSGSTSTEAPAEVAGKKPAEPQIERSEEVPQSEQSEEVPQSAVQENQSAVQADVGQVQIARGAKLSVAAKLLIPPDFEGEHFRMTGISVGTPPGLELDLVDRRGGTFVFALMALIALMIVWFSGRHSLWKIWVLLGVCLPLGLGGLIPPLYHVWLQAILLGTILGLIGIGLVRLVMFTRVQRSAELVPQGKKSLVTLILLGVCLGGVAQAEEKKESNPEQPAAAPIIQTFSDPAHPESTDQVWVPWEKYLELRSRSGNPLNGKTPTASGVYGLNLKADFPTPGTDSSEVVFQARISLYSDAEGETRIPLPIRRAQVGNAKLDGADARLVFQEGDNSSQAVIVPAKGEHVLDLDLRVPIQHGDLTRGDLRLPIRGPVAGTCELKCSNAEINLFVNQPGGLLRSSLEGGGVSYRFTLGNSIDPLISWRPSFKAGDEVVQGEVTSIVEVGSILQVTELLRLAKLKQGLSEVQFELPANVQPTNVSGLTIEGWELQVDGAKRSVRVFLKSTELETIPLTLTYAMIPEVGAEGIAEFEFTPVTPVGFTPTRNRIGIVTDDGRQLAAAMNPGWRQISPDELTDAELQNFHPRLSTGTAWEQTSGMSAPFKLSWKNRASEVEMLAVNRWHLRSEGARFRGLYQAEFPKSNTGWVRIPLVYGLFVDAVTWNGDAVERWFVVEDVSGDPVLVVIPNRLEVAQADPSVAKDNSPADATRQGVVSKESTIVVDAWFPLEPVDLEEFLFPIILPRDATKLRTFVGISHDPSLQLDLVAEGWKSIDPASRQQEFGSPLPAFAYESDELKPGEIEVRGKPSYPTVRGTTLTILDVRDDALDYLLAFQWEVMNGEASTFVFRGPEWLKERIEFVPPAGQKPPLSSVESLPGNRAQWTVTFDVPQRGKVFQIAKATLPVTTDGFVRCPALQLVDRIPPGDWKPLETQTHFQSVVNHSRNQLTLQNEPHHVLAHPDELQRAIQVPTPLLVQSIDLLREVEPLTEPVWQATPVEKTAVIPASIGLATHSFWITGDNSWRSRVNYRVTNRRRQYLPVEIPAGSRILSASAAGQAVRVLSRDVDGKKIHLIPLPKMSAGDLPFDVALTLAGTLTAKNPLWGNPTTLDLPLAHVVLPAENGELGIDVTRENVEVYYPPEISATLVEDSTRSNVQAVGEASRMLDEIETLLGEMSELADLGSSYNRDYQSQTRARSNLKGLTKSLEQAREKLEIQSIKEKQTGNEQVLRRSLQIQQQADELDRKLGEINREEGVDKDGNGILKDNSAQEKFGVSNRFQEGNTIELYNLNQAVVPPGVPADKKSDSYWSQKDDTEWSSQADVNGESGGRFSGAIDADRPRHDSVHVGNRDGSTPGGGGGFGGGGGGLGSDARSNNRPELTPEEKVQRPMRFYLPGLSTESAPVAASSAMPMDGLVEGEGLVAQPPAPPQKRVATLVSLEIDFHPTGTKQTFSRLQGGAKVAMRLWPHAWFAGVIRVVWFIAVLSFGVALLTSQKTRKMIPIISLVVVLVVTALFGTLQIIGVMSLLLVVGCGTLLVTRTRERTQVQS